MTTDMHRRPGRRGDPLTDPDWPPRPLIVAVGNGKGGVGKTTDVLGLAATAGKHGIRTLVVDTDPQSSAVKASTALRNPGYEFVAELDPGVLARIGDVEGFGLIIVDTPGNITTNEVLAKVLEYSDMAVIPSDMTVLSATETVETVDYVTGHGCRPRVLLNGLPAGASRVELEARLFLARKAIQVFEPMITRRAVHQHAIRDGIPISEYPGDVADLARQELRAVLTEIGQLRPGLFGDAETGALATPMAAG